MQEQKNNIPSAQKKREPVVNVTRYNPETPVPIDYSTNPFTIVSGQRYLPFGKDDNLPNTLWTARLNSVTQNACTTSIAQTCVGTGLYVTNKEPEAVDKEFLTFIANINGSESLNDLCKIGMEAEETDGNAWPEIVKGSLGLVKYVKCYMHTSLVCRFGAIPKDGDRPLSVVRSLKFAESRGRLVSGNALKAANIPLYSSNPLDKKTAWTKIKDELHTALHLKNTNKASLFYGIPRSIASFRHQLLESKAAQYNNDNFDNGMVLSAILMMKSSMTQEEANAAGREIIQTHTGGGKAARVAVVASENGIEDWDIKTLETQKEGSYETLDNTVERKIITASNWDKIFFGMGETSTLGQGSQYVRAVYDIKKSGVIDPKCRYWIDHFVKPVIAIAAEHLGKPEWLTYELSFKSTIPFSYSSDIDVNSVLTKNEGRELLECPKVQIRIGILNQLKLQVLRLKKNLAMYRLNPLHRNVLIVTDEVVAKAPVEADIDVRNLQNAIEVAEERFIRPILGEKMYEDFIAMKNQVVTSGNKASLQASVNETNTGTAIVLKEGQIINAIELVTNAWYKKLWDRVLWKICAECVAYVAIPTNAVRSTALGEINNNPVGPMGASGPASVSLAQVKFKMEKILMDRIDPLINSMRSWLCENKQQTDLLLWDSSGCSSCEPTHKRQTGFVYGIYDDIDFPKNCNCD